ncbi:hypothetical protein AURDEDRAFT_112284 [Auricularia subglabra TFB-10046 SS5]|nr:hypothetical protein AURDEDRAFT_112284 [Auricularia subglabra TFB-10046 SS5]
MGAGPFRRITRAAATCIKNICAGLFPMDKRTGRPASRPLTAVFRSHSPRGAQILSQWTAPAAARTVVEQLPGHA